MAYAKVSEVRCLLVGFDEQSLPEKIVNKAIEVAMVAVDACLGKCFDAPFGSVGEGDANPTPDLVRIVTEQWAAGWLLNGPLLARCSNDAPVQGKFFIKSAKKMMECACESGILEPVDGDLPKFKMLSSADAVNTERVKIFPVYSEPFREDRRPTIHPQKGPRVGDIHDHELIAYNDGDYYG